MCETGDKQTVSQALFTKSYFLYTGVTQNQRLFEMLEVFVHSLEVALVPLVAILSYRIYELSSNGDKQILTNQVVIAMNRLFQGSNSGTEEYTLKMDSLKNAQIFSGTQMLDIKREFGDLHQEQLDWLREAISLYLIGAVDFIAKQGSCCVKSRKELIALVLKSNLKLTQDEISEYFGDALNREHNSDNDHMVRAGAKAAKLWLKQKSVPGNFSLRTQLDEWGIFA